MQQHIRAGQTAMITFPVQAHARGMPAYPGDMDGQQEDATEESTEQEQVYACEVVKPREAQHVPTIVRLNLSLAKTVPLILGAQ